MRWSIIRLIWLRELRDQLRDRRTLFMVAVLPLFLYPILGFAVIKFALGFAEKPSIIGIVRAPENSPGGDRLIFPPRVPASAGLSVVPDLAWLTATPASPAPGAAALAAAGHLHLDYPAFVRNGQFTTFETKFPLAHAELLIAQAKLRIKWLDKFDEESLKEVLEDKSVDLILAARPDFFKHLEWGEDDGVRPGVDMKLRPDDDRSKQARNRLTTLLDNWKMDLRKVRLARKNLPATFDDPFEIVEPGAGKGGARVERIFDLMVRIFPFMLVMWSLAGALYPAVDLCAGEKERGTMETLLITPAGREEIVLGKFLTIWVFSAASALLNLMSMGFTTWHFGQQLTPTALPIAALSWCVVLSLPLSALFSAICLAIGAYARSSKEGQYYLMPLFLVTMPLIFLTLAPGVELNPFYSLVPVTGVALLMQRLMTATSWAQIPWLYFLPVLLPIALYSGLALKWAIMQFHREEVLFREAERLDLKLWLRRLFQDKEATPTTGQAFFCFGMILFLRWLAIGLGGGLPLPVQAAVNMLAFVAAPALFMVCMLNTQPREALLVHWPKARELGLAAVLGVLLLPPIAALAVAVFVHFPHLTNLLEEGQPLLRELRTLFEGLELDARLVPFLFLFALLRAVSEEIAFRGLILTGLKKRFRPRTSVFLCAFMFALFQMNVFQFLPAFFLGIVLGLLTLRSRSLVPAIFFHFLHDSVLLGSIHAAGALRERLPAGLLALWPAYVAACTIIALGILWWLYRKPYIDKEREEALEREQAGV